MRESFYNTSIKCKIKLLSRTYTKKSGCNKHLGKGQFEQLDNLVSPKISYLWETAKHVISPTF
ncbi:hypothetical protein NIES2101_30440 [Calothrix sp. HK-06]|nr:hypothetical protein NIES2101_30440 [Calothrix sp. HK-06]